MSPRSVLSRLAGREAGVAALWLAAVAAVGMVNPDFLRAANLHAIFVKCAPVVIVACGVTLVIVTGEIDISVGSLMGLLAVVGGIVTSPDRMGLSSQAGAAAVLAVGAGVGLLTGLLVTLGRVPSIIVTLGMLTALRGLTQVLMGGRWIESIPPDLRVLSIGSTLGVRNCLWVAMAVLALTVVLAHLTPLGRRVYAVGSSPRAAALAGLSSRRVKVFAFAFTGFLTGVATLAGQLEVGTIEPDIGQGFELLVVTCVVVGGTSIRGGVGGVFGSAAAALLLMTIGTALVFLKLGTAAAYWERAIQGAFILLAVLTDQITRRRGAPEDAS